MEIYTEVCSVCRYPAGEHSKDCPKYSPISARMTEVNLKKAVQGANAEGYRGTQFEYDVFGEVDVRDPRYLAELKNAGAETNGYLPYAKALELAKKFQPADPTNPKKDFLRELRLALIEEIGIEDEEMMNAVKIYTAVGTPLDKFHGVDAFVTDIINGRESVVTLDATLRKEKIEEGGKADLIITDLPSPEEDEEAYLKAIEDYAKRIAEKLSQSFPEAA